jgi:hypothetical protein
MLTEERKIDDRNLVDNLSSVCSTANVINPRSIAKALQQEAKADVENLKAIDAEQSKHRTAYLRFLDLEAEKKFKTERLRCSSSLVTHIMVETEGLEPDAAFDEYVIPVSDLSLWEAMRSILKHSGEIQLVELQHALEPFGQSVTRGAIESAIKTHSDVFQARTRGRERFVSLKR